MTDQVPSFLANADLRFLLLGGKGGVGKTTVAAAAARYRAARESDREILVVSTDPAHSLSDSFDQPIGDEVRPITGFSNLFALEMDAGKRLEAFKEERGEVLKTIADRGTFFDDEDIATFFELSLPGLDELMAIIEVADVVREGRHGLVILDTAPTGHTLRLLGLPRLMEDWVRVLDLMLDKHRYMISIFGRYRPDETDAFLEQMSSDLDRLRSLLNDPKATEFVPVIVPEAMSIEETGRLLEDLARLAIPVRNVVVNRVAVQNECRFCSSRRQSQQRHLDEIERRFSGQNLVRVPLLGHEVRGQEALEGYIQAMLDEELGRWKRENGEGKKEVGDTCPNLRHLSSISQWEAVRLERQELVLLGGKGGVGKTTMAAATAIHLAHSNPDKTTLLFSVDPARSLSDSLGQEIGNQITPVAGVGGLFALEMEAEEFLADLKQEYVAEIDQVFDALLGRSFDAPFDRRVMEELIHLTPPGLDELMALMRIMTFMDKGRFNRYVLDLAPTGHALRFLETPGLVRQWFGAFFELLLKYQGVVTLTRVAEVLLKESKQLRRVERVVTDAERCQLIAVTIPEAMSVLETERLLHRLEELSVACRWMVVNKIVPHTTCTFCREVREGQLHHLDALKDLGRRLTQVPLFPQEIRGVAALTRVAKTVYGDGYG